MKGNMKKIGVLIMVCSLGLAVQAQLIDDFSSGNLNAYTATRILNNGNHSPVNSWGWEINGSGAVQLNTTNYIGIEQFALTRTDYPLGVYYELTATFVAGYTGTQDIGLYVGAGTPTTDVRANYVNIYMRNNGQLFSRGFNGTTEFSLSGGGTPTVSSLFIARTATDVFELGWYQGTTRNILATRTVSNGNLAGIGNAIGFYADVRSAGIVGSMDDLTLTFIPEPGTMTLCGLGGFLGLVAWIRRRK